MGGDWSYSSSKMYWLKTTVIGLSVWFGFNQLTGLMTGNQSLNDNYFILFLVAVFVAIKGHYKVVLANSYLTISRLGMVTAYVDLYKLEKAYLKKQALYLVTKDQARYTLKLCKLPKQSHADIRHSILPLTGVRQPVPAPVVDLKSDDASYFSFRCGIWLDVNV